ncbi:MAG TPA: ATP-binding protein [Solirubrobacterales bacterium]|nr:ATP-binding protein [Solirubrobacterales bacterium]
MEGARRSYEQRSLTYLAISRLVAIPLYLGLIAVSDDSIDTVLALLIIGAVPYCAVTLFLAVSELWKRIDPRIYIATDLVLLSSVLIADGGPESQVQIIFFVWTLAMALLYPPRFVIFCAVAAMTAYALASLPFVLEGPGINETDLRSLGLVELNLSWVGLVTYFVAEAFWRRAQRIESLSDARQRLLADALSAEDRARRRLSQTLHDETLQVLLAVGQDMSTGLHGDTRLLVRAREELRMAIKDLRETIRGLHPAALEHGGLAGGLDAVVERAARYGEFTVDLRVDPAASGYHDSLVVSLVRELATNAAKHSEASQLSVTVVRGRTGIEIEVADDGKGMTEEARSTALAAGHIGLASVGERVDAAGGRLAISSAPEHGTRVAIELPLPPDGPPVAQAVGAGSKLPLATTGATVRPWPEGEGAGGVSSDARSETSSPTTSPGASS